MGSTFRAQGDRLLAVAFVLMVTLALAGIASSETGATFTGTSTNPNDHFNTMLVQPPASQSAPTSSAGGVVNLSWTATPTAPGTGHTLTYLVLRGPVGGPYTQITSVSGLSYTDTPPSDGTYQYVIQARVTGGGSFTSGNSTAQNGISDRAAPTMSVKCNGAACSSTSWYNAAISVTVSGTDAGTGMGSVTRNVDGGGQVSTAGASVTFSVSGDSANHSVVYFGTDAAGNSSSSLTQTLKIDTTAPTAVTGLTAATGAFGSPVTVDLTWTAGSDALSGVAGYTVYWVAAATCPAASPANYPSSAAVGAVTSYSISGLVSGTKYCTYLTTTDNAGNVSTPSAVAGPTKAR